MIKITFMGAGSTVFARNVLGDCMCTPALRESEIALYDIDEKRLEDSRIILSAINHNVNEDRAVIKTYLGAENRKDALRDADFVVNAIQVGGYEPCTVTDFEIPKKYGIKQTIADTLGIGGIMRALRTIPVLEEFARDMEEVCPNTLFLNYSNPMAMLTGYMQRFTKIRTVGLCHSVQVCSQKLLEGMGMEDKIEGRTELIAGINHMAWLLEIHDKDGNDLYPEIRRIAEEKNTSGEKHEDMVRNSRKPFKSRNCHIVIIAFPADARIRIETRKYWIYNHIIFLLFRPETSQNQRTVPDPSCPSRSSPEYSRYL